MFRRFLVVFWMLVTFVERQLDVIDEDFGVVVGLVVVWGEECGAAFRNGKVEIILSQVGLKGGKVRVCVGFHGGDVCASGYDALIGRKRYWF